VRRLAAEFLGGCGAAAAIAVPELVRMLGGRGDGPRHARAALQRLGAVGAPAKDALIACFEALPADEQQQRREVLATLAAVAPDARNELPALAKLLAERDAPAVPADVARHDTIAALLPQLADADPKLRMRALGELAGLRATEAVPSLLPWLAEDRPAVERSSAIQALIAVDAVQCVPRFRELLDCKQREVRTAAAQALAMFGDTESFPRVTKVLLEGLPFASSDQLWHLGLTQVDALAPALERIVASDREPMQRRWGATQALAYLGARTSAPVVAAMLAAVAADERLRDTERQQLLAVGLRTLVRLEPAPHRALFAQHAGSPEREVRDAALAGLAELGDEAAKAELAKRPAGSTRLVVEEPWRTRLLGVRLRLSEVRGNSVRDVLARLGKALGVPIVPSAKAAAVLDRRVGSMYTELVGFRPDASSVLGLCTNKFFVGYDLVPRFHDDRIELLTPEEAGEHKR
jgi:hypothetical protein